MEDRLYPPTQTEYLPRMNPSDRAFCQEAYRKKGRVPTEAEWRLLDGIVALRHGMAEAQAPAPLTAENKAPIETYRDLCAKLRVLEPHRVSPPTLSEAAAVAGAYLASIGRSARTQGGVGSEPAPRLLTAKGEAVSLSLTDTPTLREHIHSLPPETALLLLTAEGASSYEDAVGELLSSPELSLLSPATLRVGEFGLLGTLSYLSGIYADLSTLAPKEEIEPAELLLGFRGARILTATREQIPFLYDLSVRYGLRAVYFAKVTASGQWRARRSETSIIEMELSFLRRLMNGKERAAAKIPKERLRAVRRELPLYRSQEGQTEPLESGSYLTRDRLIFAPAASVGEQNPFGTAISTAIDALLCAVSAGVDRRALAFSFTYRLPRYETAEDALGKDLALILGAYRLCLELAAPEGGSSVDFCEGERALFCTAYGIPKQTPLPRFCLGGGTKLYYLSFRRDESGMPEFEDLRRACDTFHALYADGRVRSARSVAGILPEAARRMAGERPLSPTEAMSAYGDGFCQGILFEAEEILGLPILAFLEREKEI